MANSSVPKHDFAPAWLKIPGETQSSFQSEYHRERLSRRDDHSSAKGPSVGRQRQSSCDQQYLRRPEVTRKPVSHRHHSIDVDESQYYNCSLGDYSIANHRSFGSQPSLNRRPLSRQDNPLLGCPAAYRGYSLYDFSNDGSRSNGFQNWNQSRHRNFDRSNAVQNNNDKDSTGKELKECATDRFNIEFPSLRGDISDGSSSSAVATVNGGVWSTDNLRNTKIYLDVSNKKVLNSDLSSAKSDSEGRSSSPGSMLSGSSVNSGSPKAAPSSVGSKGNGQNLLSSSTYRVLVSSKNILGKKTNSKDLKTIPIVNTSNKNSRQSSPTPQLEILNTRLVTHPKNLGNKKSDFLKTLRNENYNMSSDDCQNGFKKDDETKEQKSEEQNNQKEVENQQQHQNGRAIDVNRRVSDGIDSGEKPILSSSLEAEQRLLKEMGWKEEGSGDEDVYAPLTEDEMREFENLSKKLREQNSLQRPPLTWSPKKRLPFTTAASIVELEDDSCSTTSSSDSE